MNTSIPIPSSDETVQSTPSLPELSDLNSSASTFHSSSSISSIETRADEVASPTPESQPENNRRTARTSRTSLDTSASTSTSRRPIHTRRSRPSQRTSTRRCSTSFFVLNNLLQFSFNTIMNAAITIFGVGIGVGIILADSFRSPITTSTASSSRTTATSTRVDDRGNEHATIPVSAATPTCRATIRRAIDRIQEAPPINIASISALPAQ